MCPRGSRRKPDMPAITLGLAEVEERLRVLRRRLNAVTAQHSVYLSLSVVTVALSGLIIVGLRGSTSAFRTSMWGAVVCGLAAIAWGAGAARWRWLDVTATARLADRRAALADRLVTLVDLRLRPRPSRLAPVLVAQLLALSKTWQPQLIAPRRVPRSVYTLLASLLVLSSTAFVERRPPAFPPPAQAGAGMTGEMTTTASPNAPFVGGDGAGAQGAGGSSVPGVRQAGDLSHGPGSAASGAAAPPSAAQGGVPSSNAGQQGDRSRDQGSGLGGNQGSTEGKEQPGNVLTTLPDRLQEAIRRAFHAEAMDRPQELAARSDPGNRDPGAKGDDQQRNQDRQRSDASDAGKSGSKAPPPKSGAGSGTQKGPAQTKPGEQVAKPEDGNSINQNLDGNSPAAGNGSSPGGLLDGKGRSAGASDGAAKTFKVTIISFLHAMEQKGNQPQQSNKKASASGSAGGGAAAQVALNERQLNDDALRKAEIPPEYEDIVRRVYSLRGDQ